MRTFHKKQLPLLIGLAFSAPALMAQQATDVGRITVENRPGGLDTGLITQEETPKARSSVSREHLDRLTPSAGVFQTIELLPGVNSFSQDATGLFGGGVRVRGFSGDQMGLTINGAPVNDSGSFSVFPQEYTDTENLCETFVTQGSTDTEAPHIGASGGNIGLVTCGPKDKFGVRVAQSFGQLEYRRTFMRLDTGTFGPAAAKIYISGSRSQVNKFKGPGGADRDHVDLGAELKPTSSLSLATSVLWNESFTNNIRALTSTQIATSGRDLDFSPNPPQHLAPRAGTAQVETAPADGYYAFNNNPFRNYLWTGKAEYKVSKELQFSAEPYFWYGFGTGGSQLQTTREGNSGSLLGRGVRDINGDGDTLDTVLTYGSSLTQTYRPGATLKAKWHVADQDLVVGYWFERARHRQTGPRVRFDNSGGSASPWLDDPGAFLLRQNGTAVQARDWLTITEASSLFVQDTINLLQDKLQLQLGARQLDTKREFTNYANDGAGSGANYQVDTKYSKLLPSVGVRYQLTEQQQTFFNVAQNYRVPSNFVYSGLLSGGTFVNGVLTGATLRSPHVTPETSTNMDLGYRYQGERATASASVFLVKFKNRIARSFDPASGSLTDYNVGDSTIKGFEAESGYALGGGFSVYGSATYTRSRIDSNLQNALPPAAPEATAGKQFPDTPLWMGALALNYNAGAFYSSISAKYTGKSYSTLVNDAWMDPYTQVNLAVGYKLPSGAFFKAPEVRLNVVNLFNKEYLRINSPSGSSFTVRALGAGGSLPSYYVSAPRFASVTLRSDF
ncbi:MAG: TonB-dependent receptor [Ramlibacter sp.]